MGTPQLVRAVVVGRGVLRWRCIFAEVLRCGAAQEANRVEARRVRLAAEAAAVRARHRTLTLVSTTLAAAAYLVLRRA